MNVYNDILRKKAEGKSILAVLLDPDKQRGKDIKSLCQHISPDVDYLFVGGSGFTDDIEDFVKSLKEHIKQPIIIFPGHPNQFTKQADALLFLSFISSRDSELLIGQQVRSAIRVRESKIETISMGYILIDGGRESTTQKLTLTKPLSETDDIVATAVAGELLGQKAIYLEAGSGASKSVDTNTIKAVRSNISSLLIVGGGIKTPQQMLKIFEAGADIVVIGNHFEQHPEQIIDFAKQKKLWNESLH